MWPFRASFHASEIQHLQFRLNKLAEEIDTLKLLCARSLIHQLSSRPLPDDIRGAEFKVFSQFGDDGIIQYLIRQVDVANDTFVEFGVEDYTESNTRFLLLNNNWRGLVIDGDPNNMERVRQDALYWRHDLTAISQFVARENINEIIVSGGIAGPIGLLSIDIDGNDYWVWEALTTIQPTIVIVEYNAVFGSHRAVTIPYDPAFHRTRAHGSNLYWGASLKALFRLAEQKGYVFLGCNSNGNNAYFVRNERLGRAKAQDLQSGFVQSRFRESRGSLGELTFSRGDERIRLIEHLPVHDLESGRVVKLSDLRVEEAAP